MSRIVLFGATGYTGELTARALVDRGETPVLAARSRDKLDRLAGELDGGLEIAEADVSRPASVRDLVERGDVLISTVGPFARWGGAGRAGGGRVGGPTTSTPRASRSSSARCSSVTVRAPRRRAGASSPPSATTGCREPRRGARAARGRRRGDAGRRRLLHDRVGGRRRHERRHARVRRGGRGVTVVRVWRGGRMVTERGAKRVRAFRGGREGAGRRSRSAPPSISRSPAWRRSCARSTPTSAGSGPPPARCRRCRS